MKKRKASMLTLGIILICLGSLWLFTRPAFLDSYDFSDTGQIGDTIGGITAPIINLIGAILVYLSFKEQILANKIQSDALINEIKLNRTKANGDVIQKLLNECKDEFDKIDCNGKKGIQAIYTICTDVNYYTDAKYFDPILTILYNIQHINEKINTEEYLESDKEYFERGLGIFYKSKIQKPLDSMYESAKKNNHKDILKYITDLKIEFDKNFPTK